MLPMPPEEISFLWKNEDGNYQRNVLAPNEEATGYAWVKTGKVFKVVTEAESKSHPEGFYVYLDQFDTCVPCWLVPV